MITVCDIAWVTNLCEGTGKVEFKDSLQEQWFDVTEYLGSKGHRYYAMATKYVLSAHSLLDIKEGQQPFYVIGTSTADDEIRCQISQELIAGKQTSLGATFAPNSSVNMPASCLSIKSASNNYNFTFTGFNSGFISLWKALSDVKENNVNYIVGQVESNFKSRNEGVVLWDINNINKKPVSIISDFGFYNLNDLNLGAISCSTIVSLVGDLSVINVADNDYYDVSKAGFLADFDAFIIFSSKVSNGKDGDFYIVLNDNLIFHLKLKGNLK